MQTKDMNTVQQLLTQHLDIWTTAETEKRSGRGRSSGNKGTVYGIQKLRELILELAVRGKLVPQDPNDEPASELLKSIQAEKAKLIAEGKLKKEKPLAPISEGEKPFESPDGWICVRVNDIGHDLGQKTPNKDFTYIEVSAIDNQRGVVLTPEVVKPEDAPSRARKVVKQNSIIYSTVRPYLLNIAVIDTEFTHEPIASTAFAVIHPYCDMSSRYFLYYLRSPVFIQYVESVQTGIAYPAINDGQFYSGLLALPPLGEQHRIVAKVDALMALCDQLENQHLNATEAHETLVSELLATLTQSQNAADFNANWQRIYAHFEVLFTTEVSIDALKQTLPQLAVMGKLVPQDPNDESASELLKRIQAEKAKLIAEGKLKKEQQLAPISEDEKPYELPQGWKWATLINAAVINPRNSAPDDIQASFVPMSLIGTAYNEKHQAEKRLWKEIKQGFTHFATGDIGVAKITPCFENSKACVFENLENGLGAGTTELHIVRPVFNTLNPRYVLAYLKSPKFLEIGEAKMTGTAGQKRLPKEFVESNPFPLPPLAEQHRIVAKVDALMSLCDQLKTRIQQASQQQQLIADALVAQAVA